MHKIYFTIMATERVPAWRFVHNTPYRPHEFDIIKAYDLMENERYSIVKDDPIGGISGWELSQINNDTRLTINIQSYQTGKIVCFDPAILLYSFGDGISKRPLAMREEEYCRSINKIVSDKLRSSFPYITHIEFINYILKLIGNKYFYFKFMVDGTGEIPEGYQTYEEYCKKYLRHINRYIAYFAT